MSDLSAEGAPSLALWRQLSALYGPGSLTCATCTCIYVSERRVGTRTLRVGIYLFALMMWVSDVGYTMFPLKGVEGDIASVQDALHIVVTVAVVVLSISSLATISVAGMRERTARTLGACAAVALAMMVVGSVGTAIVPAAYFGVAERLSVFAATGFDVALGCCLFRGFPGVRRDAVARD